MARREDAVLMLGRWRRRVQSVRRWRFPLPLSMRPLRILIPTTTGGWLSWLREARPTASARRQRLLLPRPINMPRLALLVRQLLLMQVELLFVPSSPFFLLLFLLLLLPFLLLLPLLLLLLLLRRLLLPLVMLPRRRTTRSRDSRRLPLLHLQAVVDNDGAFGVVRNRCFFLPSTYEYNCSWPTSLLMVSVGWWPTCSLL